VDDEAMSQSSSSNDIFSDLSHVEPHTPVLKDTTPIPTFDEPRHRQRVENSQPKGWTDGNAPPGVSVGSHHAPILKASQVCSSDPASDALEAARQRAAQQRCDDAERIRIFQVKKLIVSEAGLLRQRAADLEREVEEEEAGSTGKMENLLSAPGSVSFGVVSTVMEVEDDSHSEAESNSDYARTEMCSEAGQ
jgi:hypothetical protein